MGFALKISPFGPLVPRTAEKLLAEGYSQTASNLNLLSGEIRPIKQPLTISGSYASYLAVYRAEYISTEKWRGWTMDVDVATIPLPTDAEYRYAWTGDGPPKWTTFGNFTTAASDLTLGIPNPVAAPSVSPSGGVGAASTRIYCYTFWSQNGEESGPSPISALTTGKVDDTWAISGMDAFPANTATIQAMPASFFSTPVNTIANATGGAVSITSSTNANPSVITKVAHGFNTDDRVFITGHLVNTAINNTAADPTWRVVRLTADTYSLKTEAGVDVAGNGVGGATGNAYKCALHWLRVSDQLTTNLSATQYTVASVISGYAFTISTTTDLHTATAWTRVAGWNTTGMTRRLYRSAGTNATFQLVAENISGTTYNDTIVDSLLPGDELISTTWEPPPVGLVAVASLPSGAMVGINGAQVCFSEPYQAHAWPPEYRFGMGFAGVGLATFGSTVVVGTLGKPYIGDGTDPASTSMQSIDSVWPCLSKRSMVSVGDGVSYATRHGLAYIGTGAPKIWTQPYYTREEWEALDPTSMVSVSAEGKVFLRYKASTESTAHVLIFIPDESLAALTTLEQDCVELYSDARNGKVYFTDTSALKQYDAGTGNRMTYEWRSKEYELPKPLNLGAARVDFEGETTAADVAAAQAAYDAAVAAHAALITNGVGALNGGKTGLNANSAINGYTPALPPVPDVAFVNFTLYVENDAIFGALLYNDIPFTMPAGIKYDTFSVKVNGTVRIKNIKIAETMEGLRQV